MMRMLGTALGCGALAAAPLSVARAATTTWVGAGVAGVGDAGFERVLCADGSVALGGGIR